MSDDVAFDLVVRGGRVVDGTGVPAYLADVGVRDGRIARVGRVSAAELGTVRRVLDVEGHTVMPGSTRITMRSFISNRRPLPLRGTA
jgi:N-acyl-D-aspartate/D-glutamate deacylase